MKFLMRFLLGGEDVFAEYNGMELLLLFHNGKNN